MEKEKNAVLQKLREAIGRTGEKYYAAREEARKWRRIMNRTRVTEAQRSNAADACDLERQRFRALEKAHQELNAFLAAERAKK